MTEGIEAANYAIQNAAISTMVGCIATSIGFLLKNLYDKQKKKNELACKIKVACSLILAYCAKNEGMPAPKNEYLLNHGVGFMCDLHDYTTLYCRCRRKAKNLRKRIDALKEVITNIITQQNTIESLPNTVNGLLELL